MLFSAIKRGASKQQVPGSKAEAQTQWFPCNDHSCQKAPWQWISFARKSNLFRLKFRISVEVFHHHWRFSKVICHLYQSVSLACSMTSPKNKQSSKLIKETPPFIANQWNSGWSRLISWPPLCNWCLACSLDTVPDLCPVELLKIWVPSELYQENK